MLGLLDGDRAHQHRPAGGVQFLDLVENGIELLRLRPVDHVRVLDPDQGPVGGNDQDLEFVDLVELRGLGLRGPGHARQLLVHPEVVLEGDGGEGLVLALDLHLLLGFHRLVQPVRPATTGHEPARELVHDHDLAVVDHVVHIALEESVGAQGLVDVVEDLHVGGVPEVLDPQQALRVQHALLGEGDGLGLLVDDVVPGLLQLRPLLGLLVARDAGPRLHLGHHAVDAVVLVGGFLRGAADDEGGAGLVDEDGVHLVHDREVMPALDVAAEVELHVVAQVVEAELVVGAVGDVGPVGHLAFLVAQVVLDHPHREAEEAEDATHPLAVALGQVVVDGDHMHALARERVQVGGQGSDQGLALARLHLRDCAAVEDDAPDELDVEVAHVEHAPASLAHDREGLGKKGVQALALLQPALELGRAGGEGGVAQAEEGRFQLPDPLHQGPDGLELSLVLGADDLGEDRVQQ